MRECLRFHGLLVIAFLLPLSLAAQPEPLKPGVLIGEEQRIHDEIDAADRLAGEKRFEDAVRRYRQVLAESGDALVSLGPAEPNRAQPARWIIHRRIAALPTEARALFNRAVDDTARRWLEQGAARRDVRLLEQVVAEAFSTASADQALHLLGDLALERGEFEVAEHYWRMLARPASELDTKPLPSALAHPAPSADGALVRAKLIVGLLLRGDKAAAQSELVHFRKRHPAAAGHLAGRDGKLVDVLQQLLDADVRFSPDRGVGIGSGWPTFAGDATRNGRIPADQTPYWPVSPTWQAELPGDAKAKPHRDSDPPLGTGVAARSLAFHPVIVPGYVLVADAARVWAYDLVTGQQAAEYDHRLKAGLPKTLDLRVPSRTDACNTLTVANGRIYARFGAQLMKGPDHNTAAVESESLIACLTLERGADGRMQFQLRWQVRARLLDTDAPALFEGAPLVHAGRMYVARTRFDGRQMVAAVECYDADSGARGEPPVRRWRQEVWSAEASAESSRHRQDLLTLAGPNVVYCTHTGAIVALDAASGRRTWAYRYPTAPLRVLDGVHPRDLCPCIYAEGRIFAAPADGDRILCLDARSGERVWESNPTHVVQMLGVATGRLIVTLGGFPQGIRAYHAARGSVLWTRPDVGDLGTFGRGFLNDSLVFWPTRRGLRVLRLEDGDPVDAGSSGEPLGHLVMGDGCLIVTTPTGILGFVPPRQSMQHWRHAVEQRPDDADARYHLAMAEADSGDIAAAQQSFRRSAQLADGRGHAGRSLRERAGTRLFELLESRALRLWDQGQREESRAVLRQLISESAPAELQARAWTLGRLAGEQSIPDRIGDAGMNERWVNRRDGMALRADDFLVSLLDEDAQKQLDRRAARELAMDAPAAMRRWPWARTVRAALLADANRLEREGQAWPAAARYREALFGARWEAAEVKRWADERAALEGLIRIYANAGYSAESRALQRRLNPGRPVRANAEPPNVEPSPSFPVPWRAGESVELAPAGTWPLEAMVGEDGLAVDSDGRLFFCQSRHLSCRGLDSGKELWSHALSHEGSTSAYYAESLLVAGPEGITRLRRSDGERIWQFLPGDSPPMPVAIPSPTLRRVDSASMRMPLSGFRLAGDRLVFRRGDQQIMSLDVETGRVCWQFRAPGAPVRHAADGAGIASCFLATADAVLLQTTGGELIGMEADDGRERFRRPASVPWVDPPIAVSERLAVCAIGAQVHAVDLDIGASRWSHQPRGEASLSGAAPQLRRDGAHLIVINERNYGFELQRLRIDTGQLDLGPVFLGRERVELSRAALHKDVYAFVIGDRVLALDRADGHRRWELPLKAGVPWRVRDARFGLLIHPIEAVPRTDLDSLRHRAARVLSRGSTISQLHAVAHMLYNGWSRRTFPVIAVSPIDGRKVQEQTLPAAGPRAAVVLGDRAAIVTEGRIELLKPTK